MWKRLTLSLLLLIAMMTLSKLLPAVCSPIVSLGCAAFLYRLIISHRRENRTACILLPYAILVCLLVYSFVTILSNIFWMWHVVELPQEFVIFSDPFIPSLILNPICFVCISVMYLRGRRLPICVECRLRGAASPDQGRLGSIIAHESHVQLRNLMLMFGLLSAVIWFYYLEFYIKINANARDWYIFTWLTVITFLLDEIYFLFRYYNLYLDLKEHNEIISEDELADIGAQTYLRFYVVCGNSLYVDPHSSEQYSFYDEVIDTPFHTRRSVSGISVDEVKRIISQMTGNSDGELRFFFGRKNPNLRETSLLRYFYFIKTLPDGSYPTLRTGGDWMDFDKLKELYSTDYKRLSSILVSDTSRLATIIVTEKIFDEKGNRKNCLRSYTPTFNLYDVRKSKLDFQDDKWIRISLFNSDTRFFKLKRAWRRMMGRGYNKYRDVL